MPCLNCNTLAAENARLKDEVEAWRAHERDAERLAVAQARLDRWRSALPGLAYRPLMVLLALVDRAPRIVTVESLCDATALSPLAWKDDPHPNAASVAICQTRTVLRALAAEGALPAVCRSREAGIRNHRGLGYSIAVDVALSLRERAGELADA